MSGGAGRDKSTREKKQTLTSLSWAPHRETECTWATTVHPPRGHSHHGLSAGAPGKQDLLAEL